MNTRIARIAFAVLALSIGSAFAADTPKPATPAKDPITDAQRLKFRDSERALLQLGLKFKELELQAAQLNQQMASIRADATAQIADMQKGCKAEETLNAETLKCEPKPEPPKPEAKK